MEVEYKNWILSQPGPPPDQCLAIPTRELRESLAYNRGQSWYPRPGSTQEEKGPSTALTVPNYIREILTDFPNGQRESGVLSPTTERTDTTLDLSQKAEKRA